MAKFILSLLILFTSLASAQQNYAANSAFDCNTNEETAFLYTCNNQNTHCESFLIFKSQPFYNSVATISSLLSSNKQELALINGVKPESEFPLNKEVIVPVNCSCLARFYQANSSFRVRDNNSTYYVIATQTFQGLATCASLKRVNTEGEFDLDLDQELQVPLRCACPTPNQIVNKTSFLLTYPVNEGDSVPDIAERFNVSSEMILNANNLGEDSVIFAETTILIPLADKPTSLKTIVHTEPPSVSPSLPNNSPKSKKSKRKLYEMVGISMAGLFLVVIIVSVICLFHKERIKKATERSREVETKFSGDLRVEIASVEYSLKVFGVKEVLKATGNFSSEHRIKGSVYWGDFGGEILAVKKTSGDVSKEVNILKRLNHFNLIKILGVCENLGCFYLVFEHMKNGSLRKWLTGSESGSLKKRIQIAVDVANGLHYLHNFTQPGCVHKDIKSSNILLDRNLRAKISNFGFARGTNVATTKRVEGTRGYMAPEYLQLGEVTPKIDVYAFGVVILEIVTGKEAVFIQDGSEVLLSKAVCSIMQKENAETELISFIGFSLSETRERNVAVKLARVGVICLTREPERRPGMEEVVSMLLRIQADLEKSEPSNAAAMPMWRSSIGETNVRDEFISM